MELVTIVTVVLNDAPGLLETSHSLLNQSYQKWEQIIVYGPSFDSTGLRASELAALDHRIRVFKESDPGIYAAMNQGLELAEGRYVWFMNAGDVFYDQECLNLGLQAIDKSDYAFVSGGYQINAPKGKLIKKSKEGYFSEGFFAFTLNWCHQSIIFDTEKVKFLGGYDTKYRYASDYDLILKLTSRFSNRRIPNILASFHAGGSADNNLYKVHLEKLKVRNNILRSKGLNILSYIWFLIVILKLTLNKIRKLKFKFEETQL
jgi:putative colanic acid biosynthesis glycosyltransferase